MYPSSFQDERSSSSKERSYPRDRLSSTTSCSSMSSRSGGVPGWGHCRNSGLPNVSENRNSRQNRPNSPSYQRRTSNLSLSSSGSRQGSPGPASVMSIPTSGIGSDRYSSTSREIDPSDRRSLNSSPKHRVTKSRQREACSKNYTSNKLNQRHANVSQDDRGSSNNGNFVQANYNRSPSGTYSAAKMTPPSNDSSSLSNHKFRSTCNSPVPSTYPNKNPITAKSGLPSSNHVQGIQSKYSSSHQSLSHNLPTDHKYHSESPKCVRISIPPSTTTTPTTSSRPHASNVPQSRWQKLFSSFKKSKNSTVNSSSGSSHGSGSAHAEDAFSLKHSHNCSNSFLKAGISNMKGYKKANQDRCTAFSYLEGDPELAYFAVYDGHGGTGVANYLKDHLHEFILDQPEYKKGDMEEAVHKAFLKVDGELRTYGSATELTGSTATVILIKHGDLLCANLGDSRAIAQVNGSVKSLSQDHNTSNPKERERVYSMGGTIKDNRVGGVLIPTRSFGDFLLKSEQTKPAYKQVISVVPQMQFFKLDHNWEFVVVGSDGVWDAMSSSEMAKYIKARLAPYHYVHGKDRDKVVLSELCEQILDACCAKTVSHYGKNSCDNMTIIIIWFDHGNRNGTARSETGSSIKSSSGVSSASR